MRIAEVAVIYKPTAEIWWGRAEQEYVAKIDAAEPPKAAKASPVGFAENGALDQSNADEYSRIIATPEARDYLRNRLAYIIRKRIAASVTPKFNGARQVRLEIEVLGFTVPSAIQRVTLGGNPMLLAVTTLKDSVTGAELGKLDRTASAYTGQGMIGVLVDQGFDDLEDRVVQAYVSNVLSWLQAT